VIYLSHFKVEAFIWVTIAVLSVKVMTLTLLTVSGIFCLIKKERFSSNDENRSFYNLISQN